MLFHLIYMVNYIDLQHFTLSDAVNSFIQKLLHFESMLF